MPKNSDINSARHSALSKACHLYSVRPFHTAAPIESPVATHFLCRDTRSQEHCHDREDLCRDPGRQYPTLVLAALYQNQEAPYCDLEMQ